MKTVISKSWDFRTYRIQAKGKCAECGKSISKTFLLNTGKTQNLVGLT